MAAPLIPWEPCNIPEEIQEELNRRKTVRSFNYVDWKSGDPNRYKGPMTPWIRCCSNGRGRETGPDSNKHGFIFYGGKDFYKGYGFQGTPGNPSVIGYMPDGKDTPHIIYNDWSAEYPIHVPPPEIEKIDVTIQKEHYRRLSMEWVCFSKRQLEYMTPYLLVPGISCIVEWGWNHYDPASLLDLADTGLLEKLFHNPYPLYTKYILESKGNYDVIFGIITHFEWSIDQNKIKCRTEITSKDRIYSGLVIDSVPQDNDTDDEKVEGENNEKEKEETPPKEKDVNPLNTLSEFIDKTLTQFKSINDQHMADKIPRYLEFVNYVQKRHKNWREYVYGVFYGRDTKDKDAPFLKGADTSKDFDYKSKNENLWINLGLIIEAINFHSAPLTGMSNKEMFLIDIDDCIIGGHPNMISSDGNICLIPNSEAPKYFSGLYGYAADSKNVNRFTVMFHSNRDDWEELKFCTEDPGSILKYPEAKKQRQLYNYRLRKVCLQDAPRRDDLDELINWIRYKRARVIPPSCAFPFRDDYILESRNIYPAKYSGLLRNIYINISFLKDLLAKSDEIKTYARLVEKILEGINGACGNFWDFRLVDGTGGFDVKEDEPATMKIVDYKFMYFSNRGKPYTFDYMDADSLLSSVDFKPTISNAQAIRSIYAVVNYPNKRTIITEGTNELLDYHFGDRLTLNKKKEKDSPPRPKNEEFREMMRALQQINPPEGAFQITVENKNGQRIKRRLVLPQIEVLRMLLDDSDERNNPKYTGVMPGIQANFIIQGIGGLRTFMMFLVRNLPEPYSHNNIVFRINDIKDSVTSSGWTTTISAGIIPLRDYIKERLGIDDEEN